MEIINLNDSNFEAEVLKSDVPVLIDFWAEWCGPCKMMSPVMDAIARENSNIKVAKVNIDEEMNLALKYNVMSIPTIIAFENGEIKKRTVGAQPKSNILELLK